jgi:chromatin segregation and condensation protein Rec8/ScpA/Scc1 (kleisin family)
MQREVFGRMGVERIARADAEKNALEEDGALDVNLFDLLREIGRDEVSVVQKMNEILDSLETKEFIVFQELFRGLRQRPHLLATFLGMLELAKLRSVALRQAALFGDIRIYKRQDQEAGPAETTPVPAPGGGADMN